MHSLLSQANTLKKAPQKSISSYLFPVLCDVDPTQGVEDEYKHKHKLLFSWRMLREISDIDSSCFIVPEKQYPQLEDLAGESKQKTVSKQAPFEGNIELISLVLQEKAPKKEMPIPEEPMLDDSFDFNQSQNEDKKEENDSQAEILHISEQPEIVQDCDMNHDQDSVHGEEVKSDAGQV